MPPLMEWMAPAPGIAMCHIGCCQACGIDHLIRQQLSAISGTNHKLCGARFVHHLRRFKMGVEGQQTASIFKITEVTQHERVAVYDARTGRPQSRFTG